LDLREFAAPFQIAKKALEFEQRARVASLPRSSVEFENLAAAFIRLAEQADSDTKLITSAIGQRTSAVAPRMSAFGGKADMSVCTPYVCF